MKLEDRITDLKNKYVQLMEEVRQFYTTDDLFAFNKHFQNIAAYDIKIHEDVLNRQLNETERRFVITNRFYERYLELYATATTNSQILIPTNDNQISSFCIEWYENHKLWIV